MKRFLRKKWVIGSLGFALVILLLWVATTRYTPVWAFRNTLQYHIYTGWWSLTDQTTSNQFGSLQGTVTNTRGAAIEGVWVIVPQWDGTTYIGRTDADGRYTIEHIPIGTYHPVATAPGYQSVRLGGYWNRVTINPNATTIANTDLTPEPARSVTPGTHFALAEPKTVQCDIPPFETTAIQRQIHFLSDDEPNQLSFYYPPPDTAPNPAPLLLVIYPGPADGWVCASLSLVKAGYAVIAAGPAYTFDLEADLDELERLLTFVREGQFPGSDGRRIAIMGGSYSSLHVQRLLQRGQQVDAALLLGPPTDLFDMRRRQEDGSFVPPFGLDQAFIAMGFPHQDPLLYLKYSGAYHVRADFPPLAILHSRGDDTVPYQQSERLAANMEAVGAPYELHLFEGGHYLIAEQADADSQAIYDTTLEFLAKHLMRSTGAQD
ncbi:MAG: carboxypeptidase regulatory-like domain-containing protein [Anaerolineae bacterium]|nr:carboxypeptidase regulatory-like domain-containing protein [Anaerolineae bacterium]